MSHKNIKHEIFSFRDNLLHFNIQTSLEYKTKCGGERDIKYNSLTRVDRLEIINSLYVDYIQLLGFYYGHTIQDPSRMAAVGCSW